MEWRALTASESQFSAKPFALGFSLHRPPAGTVVLFLLDISLSHEESSSTRRHPRAPTCPCPRSPLSRAGALPRRSRHRLLPVRLLAGCPGRGPASSLVRDLAGLGVSFVASAPRRACFLVRSAAAEAAPARYQRAVSSSDLSVICPGDVFEAARPCNAAKTEGERRKRRVLLRRANRAKPRTQVGFTTRESCSIHPWPTRKQRPCVRRHSSSP